MLEVEWIEFFEWCVLYGVSALLCSGIGYLSHLGYKKWGSCKNAYWWMWVVLLVGGVFGWMTFMWLSREDI